MLKKKIRQSYQLKEYSRILLIAAACFAAGIIIGFYFGVETTIKSVAEIASRFVDIDENLIKQAIYQYNNNIGNCFPKNISI